MYLDGKEIVSAGYPESEHQQRQIRPTFCWEIINICNYKCNYCSAGYGDKSTRPVSSFYKDEQTKSSWRSVITKLGLVKHIDWNISLLGGEPTLHPELKDIIKSLLTIDRCSEVCLITNMSKDIDYFVSLYDDLDTTKCWVNPSIHFQYYKSDTINKIIQLTDYVKVVPTIMLSDKRKHWQDMLSFFEYCISNNITYNSTFLEPMYDYKPAYSSDFFNTFMKYIQHGKSSDDDLYSVRTSDGASHNVTIEVINRNDIKKFKGWTCTPKSWSINERGNIVNSCSRKPLKLGGGNIATKETCPRECCNCNEWWMYDKHK
jgi:organic radical activating enzyme